MTIETIVWGGDHGNWDVEGAKLVTQASEIRCI
jgi:hypothetical protein